MPTSSGSPALFEVGSPCYIDRNACGSNWQPHRVSANVVRAPRTDHLALHTLSTKSATNVSHPMTESARLPGQLPHELTVLFDLTPNPVRIVDLGGHVLQANASAAQEYRDVSPVTLRELWERRAATFPDRDARIAYVDSAGMRALAGRTVRGALIRVRDVNGDERILAAHAAPTRDAEQRVTGAVLLDVDVTERYRRTRTAGMEWPRDAATPEATLDDTARAAEVAVGKPGADFSPARLLAAIAHVTAIVVHDVNNALNPILSAAYLLEHHAESPEMVRHYAGRIRAATEAGASVSNRLARFLRQEPLRESEGELIQISLIVDEALDSVIPPSSRTRRAGLAVTLQHGEPNCVRGLPDDLRHAVVNVLQNAIEAMPLNGALSIQTGGNATEAFVTVKDNGHGMPDAVRACAFEPFFSTKQMPGAGLGLAEVYSIAKRHGGDVVLTSQVGVGTTVTLRLPIARVPDTGTITESPRLTILVVEDHEDGREFVSRVLRSNGHSVDAVANCAEARQRLAADGAPIYNLLLTDVSLPDGSGWELLAFVKVHRPSLRVGIITGWEPSVGSEVAAGAAFILQKPLRATELLQRVESQRTTHALE